MTKLAMWTNELKRISEILKKAPLESTVKWGTEVFTFNGKNIVSYGGFKNYFALWFYNGIFLNDHYDVLINAQDGKTKSLRQWRLTKMEDIDEEKILEYVMEVIDVKKRGLRIKPEVFTTMSIPILLQKALEKDSMLQKAFENLTPGKQKEYMVHIEEAKQEKTKINRLDKILPLILDGKGLNDKYK